MNKLLAICPSRMRPKILTEMLESYYKTKSPDTDIIIYVAEDDPCLFEYRKLPATVNIGRRRHLAEAYNYLFKLFSGYDYYAPINDDHYFITQRWDQKLIEIIETQGRGWGLAAAEDSLTNWSVWQHPSGCVISGNIPRTLGYFIWPKIQHMGIDDYFQHLMQGIDRLFHTTEVVIEHRHWINSRRLLDENYKWVYGQEQQQYGWRMIAEYTGTQLTKDIEKLKEAMKRSNEKKQ